MGLTVMALPEFETGIKALSFNFHQLEEALINSQFPGIHILHCLQGTPCAPWINRLHVLFDAHGAPCEGSLY